MTPEDARRAVEHGADIVVHALTKYMGGHGTSIGGIIVDSGKFPWAQHKDKFRRLSEPDVSYHGVTYTESFGEAAYIARARVVPLRNMGAAISPFNSFLILQGLETLPLRMDRHCDNAERVVDFLTAHPAVGTVIYPGLETHPGHHVAARQMKRFGGMVSFRVNGGEEAALRVCESTTVFTVHKRGAKSKTIAAATIAQITPSTYRKAACENTVPRRTIVTSRHTHAKATWADTMPRIAITPMPTGSSAATALPNTTMRMRSVIGSAMTSALGVT